MWCCVFVLQHLTYMFLPFFNTSRSPELRSVWELPLSESAPWGSSISWRETLSPVRSVVHWWWQFFACASCCCCRYYRPSCPHCWAIVATSRHDGKSPCRQIRLLDWKVRSLDFRTDCSLHLEKYENYVKFNQAFFSEQSECNVRLYGICLPWNKSVVGDRIFKKYVTFSSKYKY
jgi:hypothetical protein